MSSLNKIKKLTREAERLQAEAARLRYERDLKLRLLKAKVGRNLAALGAKHPIVSYLGSELGKAISTSSKKISNYERSSRKRRKLAHA